MFREQLGSVAKSDADADTYTHTYSYSEYCRGNEQPNLAHGLPIECKRSAF